jgi:hypothetical protein
MDYGINRFGNFTWSLEVGGSGKEVERLGGWSCFDIGAYFSPIEVDAISRANRPITQSNIYLIYSIS